MARTTLDLDGSVLEELKRRRAREGKPLGQIASELLARALADDEPATETAPLVWAARPMRARVDLDDPEAVRRVLDGPG